MDIYTEYKERVDVTIVVCPYSSMQCRPPPLVFGFYISSFTQERIHTVSVSTQDRQHQGGSKMQNKSNINNFF